jgi:hypothetical protein
MFLILLSIQTVRLDHLVNRKVVALQNTDF